jgi:Domain of unknown function (DUF1707)/Inner membrane component of T3SS, cytoplasmic domain
MRASRNRLADDGEGVRASDAERDHAIGQLRDRFAEGRLSQDTFLIRVDAALVAKDRSDLSELFTDLPGSQPRSGQPHRGPRIGERLALVRQALSGHRGYPGPNGMRQKPAPAGLPPLWLPPQEDRRFTIGRAMACDFTLADLSVSRWHARLYRKDDDWLLSDLGSTNGTRLNGWRVTTGVPVMPGDQVSFGSVSFVITDRAMGTE